MSLFFYYLFVKLKSLPHSPYSKYPGSWSGLKREAIVWWPGGELDDGDAAAGAPCPGQPRLVLGQPEEVERAAMIINKN